MANDWKTVPLAQVLQQDTNYVTELEPITYPKLSVKLYGKGVTLDAPADGANVRMQRHQFAKPGQVILSEIWAKKGAIGIVPLEGEGALVTSHFFLFDIIETKVLPTFIAWLLKGNYFAEALDAQAHGTTGYAAIRPKQFLTLEIPLPPLPEQRRIVSRIEALAVRLAAAQFLRREASEETELLLAAQLKNIRQKLLKSNLPKRKIGDIARVTSGGTPSRDNPTYWGGDIPWIKTGELIDGDNFESEEHITQEGMERSSAQLFPAETILIALYGQGQTRGRTGRLMIEATTNQACCAILPTPDILDPRFTQYWQRSLYYKMREKSHGGAQPNWNGGMIKNIEIALPPLEEQRRLVAYLDGLQAQVSHLRLRQAETQQALDALMPSILDKAFKGEL